MARVTFVNTRGEIAVVEAPAGSTVMEAARNNGIEGIDGDCSGERACATCHVIVSPEWFARVGNPGEDENDLLDFVDEREATSRLSCQIVLSEALNGLNLRIPASQR